MKLWNQIQFDLPEEVRVIVNRYLNLEINGIKISTPYWRDKGEIRGFLGGKATPEELQLEVDRMIKELDLDLHTPESAIEMLKRKKMGVDCSGLAYQVLCEFNKSKSQKIFDDEITPTPGGKHGNPKRFKTNAASLTSKPNARPLGLGEIEPGDMIRMEGGKHLGVILDVKEYEIVYLHSSQRTQVTGVHLAKVIRKDGNLGWEEMLASGESIGAIFNPANGDGFFRIAWW